MKGHLLIHKILILLSVLLASTGVVSAAEPDSVARRRFVHSFGAEFRPEYIFPTNPFLQGVNFAAKPLELSLSAHLRYSFQPSAGSRMARVYPGVYQGLGAAYYNFGNARELGNPFAIYLFQGARIARISPRLSFNYEWNFGLSMGWKPYEPGTSYDPDRNRHQIMIGSKLNAYLNVDFYLLWRLSRRFDLSTGFTLSHFSNGNTKFPNAGLNTGGLKLGLTYNFGPAGELSREFPARRRFTTPFPRHMSYDVVLFGSWRRKGVAMGEKQYPSPDAYGVLGVSVAAMYNFSYRFRVGAALDGVYDGSANVYTEDVICDMGGDCPDLEFFSPGIDKQLALGVSARAEFVMPYFTIGIGVGVNAVHKGGDMKQFYQMLTLKIAATRNSFVHIGYNLRDFHDPNYLMLGFGFRFNNKYPRLR